jgi:hypothetical protein
MNETLVVRLSDYHKEQVQVYATHRSSSIWDITINDMNGIWLGDGKYIAEHNRGIEDCDAQFSELDYRLIEEALGIMVKEIIDDSKESVK